MDQLPVLAIALVTCERTELALRTIRGIRENLVYPNELIKWFVGDDGSSKTHSMALITEINSLGMTLADYHNEKFMPDTYFAGKTWNRALGLAHQESDYVMLLEDDWELRHPLHIEPYIKLLSEREDVGMVRLGHLAVGSIVEIVGHGGIHYLNYLRGTQYAYSGNPSIRHGRFTKALGFLAENKTPGEIELDYDDRFQNNIEAPSIWRPADIPGWGIFAHIGTQKSWE